MVAMVLIVATTTFVHAQPRPDELPSFRFGGGLVDMGVNVGPYRLLVPSTSVGFDLRMRWPSPPPRGDVSALQPYFLLGPTFVMPPPDHITRTPAPRPGPGRRRNDGRAVRWSVDPTCARSPGPFAGRCDRRVGVRVGPGHGHARLCGRPAVGLPRRSAGCRRREGRIRPSLSVTAT